jgi:Ca2+-binding EF-hand superfamily protein
MAGPHRLHHGLIRMRARLVIAALLLAGAAAAAPLPQESIYVRSVFPYQTLDKYLERLQGPFRLLDTDGDGILSPGDIDRLNEQMRTARRASLLGELMRKDADGDGVVTLAEIRAHYTTEQQRWSRMLSPKPDEKQDEKFKARFEDRMQREMAADLDGDGRITMQEIYAHSDQQGRNKPAPLLYRMSAFDPAERSAAGLRWDSVRATASAYFASLDTDKNGMLSQEEAHRIAPRNHASPPLYPRATGAPRPGAQGRVAMQPGTRRPVAQPPVRELCELPLPSAKAQIALLSAYGAAALSSVTIGSQDVEVGTATIDIAPGNTPLYVVITSHDPVIWRFTGATHRVEQAVINSTQHRAGTKGEAPGLAGATGLPARRVTFPPQASCIRHFRLVPSVSAALASGVVRDILGRGTDIQTFTSKVSVFRLPSGEAQTIKYSPDAIPKTPVTVMLEGGPVTLRTDNPLARDVWMFNPGGVVTLDPAQVVASQKPARYAVLPNQAGLLQLVQQGALTYRNREFHIHRKIRFPAAMHGSHSATFLLRKGVPPPEGDPGHSCVVSEETGQILSPVKALCR